jgi:hypothetical protein
MLLIYRIFPPIQEFFRKIALPQRLDDLIARVKVPQNPIWRFIFCLLSELISFFIIATNFRALAKGYLFWTIGTDGLIVLQNTIISKLFNENEKMRDGLSIASFTLGGMMGSALSIILTKSLWGS